MLKNTKNVPRYCFGSGALNQLDELLVDHLSADYRALYIVDHVFNKGPTLNLPQREEDTLVYYDSSKEPSVDIIDSIRGGLEFTPDVVIGVGGGCALDTAKAVGNMITNPGKAEDYQGWDLLKNPSAYTVGIPTLSGTGAEASRTCVLMNYEKQLKLGMNSDHTMFDQLILDPDLTKTVPRDQYFYTGMDTFLHCVESLEGSYRNAIIDALSHQALVLCEEIFLSDDMMSDENREKMMIASYIGGCAAGNVGVVHPLSAGLSVVFGTHHCLANCLVMQAMKPYYPSAYETFERMRKAQGVELPKGICEGADASTFEALYNSSTVHEKPLTNALGENFRDVLTLDTVTNLYQEM